MLQASKKLALALSTILILFSGTAWAQGRVIIFDEEAIEGEIEKPEAFYILSPSNLEYEPVDPERSFLEALDESVRSPLF